MKTTGVAVIDDEDWIKQVPRQAMPAAAVWTAMDVGRLMTFSDVGRKAKASPEQTRIALTLLVKRSKVRLDGGRFVRVERHDWPPP